MLHFIIKLFKLGIKFGILALLTVILSILLINVFVIVSTYSQMNSGPQTLASDYQGEDVPVLVLGAGVINNELPSGILQSRLDEAFAIYQAYPEKRFIMSGDHRQDNYNEVGVMKQYLVDKGVPGSQIYLDHAGYSTYDSLYRLKNVLQIDRVVLVTQGYHLSRALMLAKHLGVKAEGIAAPEVDSTRFERESREVFARLKDFAVAYLSYHPQPPETGLSFNIYDGGDITDDKDNLR